LRAPEFSGETTILAELGIYTIGRDADIGALSAAVTLS
jgi:hypothetical protein